MCFSMRGNLQTRGTYFGRHLYLIGCARHITRIISLGRGETIIYIYIPEICKHVRVHEHLIAFCIALYLNR